MTSITAPCGTWKSPITADVVLKSGAKVDEVFVDPVTSTIYHIERRPIDGGRMVIVDTEKGEDVVGKGWDVRTAVHEYGGVPATAHGGVIYFSNVTDGRVYKLEQGKQPEAITPENNNFRYANISVHPQQTHLLVAILEDHTKPDPADIVNTLCLINSKEKTVSTLVAGADFYAKPSFTLHGAHIAWVQWFHPDMPWEGAEICVADVNADASSLVLSNTKVVAGKRIEVSVGYPSWASNDLLLFVSDASGYHNPWTYSVSSGNAAPVLPRPIDEDFAESMWFISFNYGVPLDQEGKMALFTALRDGRNILYLVSLQGGTLEELESPYVSISYVQRVTHDAVVFLGEKNNEFERMVLCNIKDYAKPKYTALGVQSATADLPFPSSYISEPQAIALKESKTGEPVHLLYYPPTNRDYVAPEGEKPPVVFSIHGGPTARSKQGLNLTTQFYTSRGWAWVDVNYGGSSGYGRKYIKRLEGNWGISDVRDSVVAVQQLAAPPYSLIDPQRSAITGGSAGGYTVLKVLCSAPDAFAAGASSFGISDFFKLAEFTHKFESHYLFKLVGGRPEEIPEVYKERSPVFLADKIRAPLLVLQGSADKVVPPQQAEGIVETIKKRGGRVEYVVFEGEGHGWRKEEHIRAALEKELSFYENVFGLKK